MVLDVGRRDDVYVGHGVSGVRARRPEFDAALDALETGDTLVVTTLGSLSRSTISRERYAPAGPRFAR
ncbi:recombinase family protein [Cryobacterium sp. Hz9]|uniref:recombinase family protein n=1 Tax=Cryobacterium sp. Hz9 TaxID=1259167 RepID=UPI0035153C1D